jgi:hypothetical protein
MQKFKCMPALAKIALLLRRAPLQQGDHALGATLLELCDCHLHAMSRISIESFRQAVEQTVPFASQRRMDRVSLFHDTNSSNPINAHVCGWMYEFDWESITTL